MAKKFWVGLSITKQLALLLSLFLCGPLVSVGFFYTFISRMELDINLLNLASRQGLLADQLYDHAYMVHLGQEEDREGLGELVDKFDRGLGIMEEGGKPTEGEVLFSSREGEVELGRVRQLWSELKPSLSLIVERPVGDPQAERAYDFIESSTPLLTEAADQLVAAFIKVNSQLKQQIFLFLSVVAGLDVLLLLVGIWTLKNYVTERRQAEEDTRIDLALQRVRNQILQMRGVEDWRKVVVIFEQELREVIEFKDCGINLIDRQRHSYLDYETTTGAIMGTITEKGYKTLPRSLAQALDTGKPVYRRNRAEIDQFEDPIGAGTNCVLDVPFAGGTVAINSSEENAFSARDIQVLEQFAQVMSGGYRRLEDLKNLALQEELLHQAQKLEAVGQLATGVAHEINNPLTAVLGYSELLLHRELDPQVRAHLETIHQEGRRAEGIAARLLQFVRRQKASTQSLSLNLLVQEVLALVGQQFELDHVQLTPVLASDLPRVQGHPGQLQQLLLALLQNSREAITKSGDAGAIKVGTRRQGNQVQLVVEDDGPGIPEALRERIFEPFFTTKEVGAVAGAGLGLSLCYTIAQEHSGRLWVEPRAAGACLVLELPAGAGVVESQPEEE